MGVRAAVVGIWQRVAGVAAAADAGLGERKTAVLPSILSPYNRVLRPGQNALPKPTAANLRKFSETPVVRRAINVVKDKVASMDWQVRVRRGYTGAMVENAEARMQALRLCLEEPNSSDSFRVLWEQVLEDLLVGGFGAVEMEATGDPARPFHLWPVDGATIQIDARWDGDPAKPRYAQATGQMGTGALLPLLDDELMYVRLNPRSYTPFGLGRLEVAFETVNQFLSANRYAGRLASNSVAQYAIWLNEATPEEHDRMVRWWQDAMEGTGRVPFLSCEQKPEVLKFAGGTDADLRLQWQEMLIRLIANAFELPPMLLGLQSDVNRSTAGEMADEAFQSAVMPVAKLLAEHITRDLFAKKLGWREFEFCFNDLESRDEMEEVQIQTALLQAGVLGLKTAQVKELANDVTVSGDEEPAAYVTETFAGDGTTTVFQLSESPFRPKRTANSSLLLADSFNEAAIDAQVWQVADPGSHLGLTAAGLTMTGGNGLDGQTALTAIDAVEMGGTLVVEAGRVQLGGASAGVVCGLYSGATATANCFAGYNVRQSGGNTVIVPLVNGLEVGTVFTMVQGHVYTLRIRLHCVEMQRVLQAYYAMVDGAVQRFGGGVVTAPMSVVFELQDLGVSSNTPATVLYDGAVAGMVPSSPSTCSFVAVNSVQLVGSMGYCRVTQTGSAWVVSTLPSGVTMTRLIGVAGEGVDCKISATGKVTFLAGRVPVAGEFVTVVYRVQQRAVARLENATSVAAEAAGGGPGTAKWLGKVLKPEARSSVDCESAALAVLSFAASRSAALSGTYVAVNPADVWPGDVLALTANDQTTSVVVRRVEIVDGMAWPEVMTYRMGFANDWAEGLGLTLSETVAANALLPETPLRAAGNVLANLQQLQIVSATGTALQVDAGTAPPAGGGFEVRRRDGDFGPGVDQDLVLRSPVRSFSIPREGQVEHYYVRMYDGSTPPVYSRFSSAVFTDLPVSE